MITLFQKKRLLLAACILLGSASQQTHTAYPLPASVRSAVAAPINGIAWVRKNPKDAAFFALVIACAHSLYTFTNREPDFSPNRYDVSKLNLQLLMTNPKAFFKNLNYFYEDGLIGHPRGAIGIKPDGDYIPKHKYVPSRGLYGWVHSRTKALIPPYMLVGVNALTIIALAYLITFKTFHDC